MFTKTFLLDVAERAVKSFAQGSLLAVGADQLNVFHADFPTIVGFGLGMAMLSILTSFASKPVGNSDSASLVG